jgi:hypothetical protein
MARASKEAVMVVIDTSASMAEPYPIDHDDSSSGSGSSGGWGGTKKAEAVLVLRSVGARGCW